MANPQAAQNLLELQNKSYDIKFELSGSQYKPVENIGTGAYGVVCSAVNTKTNKKVAIKKIPDIFEQPTIAKRTYREIKILKHLKHDNIIAIREILKPNGAVENLRDVYIVLDLMETDLHRIIHSKQDLTDEHVRYFLYQLLRGLKYIHSANIIHRDLKPSNLLVNENCDLKIGDFGMARAVSSNPDECNFLMTQYVATRWYRAPELMMARLAYTGAVDMWSVGCIFAEMLGRKQLFPGRDFIHQLQLIIGILGTPCKDFMKLTQSDTIKKFISGWGKRKPIPFKQLYPKAQPSALGLLSRMLQINPQTRVSILDALSDPFLSKYHDPQDEPDCIPAFDFDFEKQKASIATVKQSIIKEILDYHKEPEKPKILFDFRPVPKDEIKPKPAKNSTPTSDQDSNFGLNAFLSKLREQGTQKSDSPSVKQSSGFAAFLAQQANSVDQNKRNLFKTAVGNESLSFLSTNSPPSMKHDTEDAGFKVPKGLPLSKMKSLSVSPEVVPESSQDDIEMLSAKSQIDSSSTGKDDGSKIPEKWQQLSVTTANGSQGDDVEMLSAKSSKGGSLGDFKSVDGSSRKTGDVSDGNQGKLDDGAEKAVNTKEVLKAAILNAALRKQKGEYVEKPRPMTALQKQREREDKKKKKLEKSMERKKKKVPTATLR